MITLIHHPGIKRLKGLGAHVPSPPVALAVLGGYLKSRQIPYLAIDACAEGINNIRKYSKDGPIYIQGLSYSEIITKVPANSKIIGFSCLTSHDWLVIKSIAQQLRQTHPKAIFIIGGEYPSALPHVPLKNNLFDAVILREGEVTLYELIQTINTNSDWQKVNGIAFLSNGLVIKTAPQPRISDIDSLPWPDWDNWNIETYIKHNQIDGALNQGRSMPIMGSRGCPFKCKFCSNGQMWQGKLTPRSPKNIVDEMQHYFNKYKVTNFTFYDPTFIHNNSFAKEFTQEILNRKLKITYQVPIGTRSEAIDQELINLLEKSGLTNFAVAPESASPLIIKAIDKRTKPDKIFDVVRMARKTKIRVCVFFVVGFPEETLKSLWQTFQMVLKFAFLGADEIVVLRFTPYPGTMYYEELKSPFNLHEEYTDTSVTVNYYNSKAPSYSPHLRPSTLTYWMYKYLVVFYVLIIFRRPLRFFDNFWVYLTTRFEYSRLMHLVNELFVTRSSWLKKVDQTHE